MTTTDSKEQIVVELESFLARFKEYAGIGKGGRQAEGEARDALRSALAKAEPKITDLLLKILGDGVVTSQAFGSRQHVSYRDLLCTALLPSNLAEFDSPVVGLLEKAIGTVQDGLWPPKTLPPVLAIRDPELKLRSGDLLNAPGNYDRVIREATTVLEDRIRRKPGHEALSRLIPNSSDQTGHTLINKLFNPDKPVLEISSDKTKRVALQGILLGAVSYLRNPHHHSLDPQVEWSWAWSVVGLIDHLLADVDSCTVNEGSAPKA